MLNLQRDGFVLALLVVMVALLTAALTGAHRAFGYLLVALLGMFMAMGFMRRHDRLTWVPPMLATTVLLVAFTGMFANEAAPVVTVDDTVMGFQRGTAFLVYGVWIPAFFTLGVAFALLFDRLGDATRSGDEGSGR